MEVGSILQQFTWPNLHKAQRGQGAEFLTLYTQASTDCFCQSNRLSAQGRTTVLWAEKPHPLI